MQNFKLYPKSDFEVHPLCLGADISLKVGVAGGTLGLESVLAHW